MSRPHPDYLGAVPSRRWDRPLADLFAVLKREAQQSKGRPTWRVLPRGAVVSLRVRSDFRLELRISRRRAPASERDEALWERELETFVRVLGCVGWTREDDPDALGVAARFVEPEIGANRAEREANPDLFGPRPRPGPPSALAEGR